MKIGVEKSMGNKRDALCYASSAVREMYLLQTLLVPRLTQVIRFPG